MPSNNAFASSVNELLGKLEDNPSIETGIELANQIVSLFGEVNTKSVEDVFESSLELPNAERYDSWFQPHPIFKSDRACFDLVDAPLLQAKFYWLKKRSRQILAGGVHFTPNYEDEEFTHNERYKVGLDFFLSPNGKSLQVVLSNRGNLRIVELSGRLNNTQKEIFEKWIGAGSLKSQEALHTTLWESFKLKSVNQKFYDGVSNSFTELLQHLKSIDKDEEEAKLFASRLLGRLLFCWFLRKKGIIDESVGYFNAQSTDATSYYKQSLERLFFLTLNTPIDERDELTKQHQKALFPELLVDDQPSLFRTDQKTPYLNGGLFEPHENDWYTDESLTLPEGFFTNLYDHFDEFNFTTDESSPEYEQIAIDPEMLGRVFESLLATQVDETGQQARKAKGAFYTPREIVSYMCKESLRNYLYNAVNNDESTKESIDSLLDISDSEWAKSKSNTLRDKVKDNRTQIIDALDAVTILDPACGSGAFPMGMLQLMLKTYERLESRFDPYKTKLSVIQNNIFGVDIEPMAVEISRLRAWLSLIVDEDDPRSVDPLPNLDFKFVCANSLIPLDKEIGLFSDSSLHQKLKDIRTKYFNARKKHTKKALQDEYYKLTSSEQTTLITDDTRTKQLKSFDPFKNSQPADFFDSDHMFGASEGFALVIGNPPYFQLQKNKTVSESIKDLNYATFSKSTDVYCIFYEKGLELLKDFGVLTFITSNSWLKTKYGRPLRELLVSIYDPRSLTNFDNSQVFDTAVVESNILTVVKQPFSNNLFAVDYNQDNVAIPIQTFFTSNANRIENPSIDGWIIGSDEEYLVRTKIEKVSKPLKQFNQKIYIGILNGLNDAYVIDTKTKESILAKNPKAAEIIKPMLRGRDVSKYHYKWDGLWMINAHNGIKSRLPRIDVEKDYPAVYDHLLGFKEKLEIRKNRGVHWTNLRNCGYFEEFDKPKIIWGELSDKPKFAYDDKGFFAEATLFALVGDNLKFLLGILNSSLALWYFQQIATSSGMGTSRWKKYKIESMPIAIITDDKKKLANEISEKVELALQSQDKTIQPQIDRLIYRLYDLNESEVKLIEDSVK